MNIGALRAIQRNKAAWLAATDTFRGNVPLAGLDLLGALFKLSHACLYLPYVLSKSSSVPLGAGPADAFRFFRGIAYYAQHRLVFDHARSLTDTVAGPSMADYAESAALFVGDSEVCPAPHALVDLIESGILDRLKDPSRPSDPAATVHCTADQMLAAVRLSGLLTTFCVAVALHAWIEQRSDPSARADRDQRLALPIPYVRWTLRAVLQGRGCEHLRGLSRILEAARTQAASWNALQTLLERMNAHPDTEYRLRQDEAMDAAEATNRDLVDLLDCGPAPRSSVFASTLKKILYA
jgi:hypothetical protein